MITRKVLQNGRQSSRQTKETAIKSIISGVQSPDWKTLLYKEKMLSVMYLFMDRDRTSTYAASHPILSNWTSNHFAADFWPVINLHQWHSRNNFQRITLLKKCSRIYVHVHIFCMYDKTFLEMQLITTERNWKFNSSYRDIFWTISRWGGHTTEDPQ